MFIRLDRVPACDRRTDGRNCCRYYSALHCMQCGRAVMTQSIMINKDLTEFGICKENASDTIKWMSLICQHPIDRLLHSFMLSDNSCLALANCFEVLVVVIIYITNVYSEEMYLLFFCC